MLTKVMRLTSTGVDLKQFPVGLNLASFPEAAQFVAREKELSKMHKLLYGHISRSAVVLHGLGGIGKTQLAIEYVRRHKGKYMAIFWLNTNDEFSLRLSFRGIEHHHCHSFPRRSIHNLHSTRISISRMCPRFISLVCSVTICSSQWFLHHPALPHQFLQTPFILRL